MSIHCSLMIHLVLLGGTQGASELDFGVAKIGAESVRATARPGYLIPPTTATYIQQDQARIYIDKLGFPISIAPFDNTWESLKNAPNRSGSAGAPAIKVIVVQRADILEVSSDGITLNKKWSLEQPELTRIKESLALFANLIPRFSDYQQPTIDFEIDTEEMMDVAEPERPAFGVSTVSEYLRPLINGYGYEQEDKKFRGPYDLVILVHPGLTTQTHRFMLNGSPVASVPFFSHQNGGTKENLSLELLEHFYAGQLQLLQAQGVPTNFDWDLAKVRITEGFRLLNGNGLPMSVRQPLLDEIFIKNSRYANPAQPNSNGGWNLLSTESLQLKIEGRRGLVLRLRDQTHEQFLLPAELAYSRTAEKLALVSISNRLGFLTSATNSFEQPTPISSQQAPPYAWGNVTPLQAGSVQLGNSPRVGGIVVLTHGQFTSTDQILEFTIESDNPGPLAVWGADSQGKIIRYVGLNDRAWIDKFGFPFGGKHSAGSTHRIPIALLGDMDELCSVIVGAHPLEAELEPVASAQNIKVFDVKLNTSSSSTTVEPASAIPNASGASLLSRKAAIAKLTLQDDPSGRENILTALTDDDDGIKIQATYLLTKQKLSGCETALAQNLRSLNSRLSFLAAQALSHQGTPAAWLILNQAVEVGPFEFTKGFAAIELAKKNDPQTAGTLSTLIASRSWRTRWYASQALSSLRDDKTAVAMMAFLQEVNAGVRLITVQKAQLQVDLVMRRLLWSAVNDSSDAVRAWSYIGLTKSSNPIYRNEGFKGVRDDSVETRKIFLEYLMQYPAEDARGALRIAVLDSTGSVRALALRAMAKLPGAVTKDEVQPVWNDEHPEVVRALADLKKIKGL